MKHALVVKVQVISVDSYIIFAKVAIEPIIFHLPQHEKLLMTCIFI